MQNIVLWTLMLQLHAEGCHTRLPFETMNGLLSKSLQQFVLLHVDITENYPPTTPAQIQQFFHTPYLMSAHVSSMTTVANESYLQLTADFESAGGPENSCDGCD